jgi:hypothetical protein
MYLNGTDGSSELMGGEGEKLPLELIGALFRDHTLHHQLVAERPGEPERSRGHDHQRQEIPEHGLIGRSEDQRFLEARHKIRLRVFAIAKDRRVRIDAAHAVDVERAAVDVHGFGEQADRLVAGPMGVIANSLLGSGQRLAVRECWRHQEKNGGRAHPHVIQGQVHGMLGSVHWQNCCAGDVGLTVRRTSK